MVTKKSTEKITTGVGCAAFIFGVVLSAVAALVLMKGWEWFVADTFGVRVLTFAQSWGVLLLARFVSNETAAPPSSDGNGKPPSELLAGAVSRSLARSFGVWLVMYILSSFV